MGVVLAFPLTPIPLALYHVDGKIHKTQKVALMHELEKSTAINDPVTIDVVIVDGLFFLHLLPDLPETFGSVSKFILKRLCSLSHNRVFGRTITPSIKDIERGSRARGMDRCAAYEITGPTQKRPNNFLLSLRNNEFKNALVQFLIKSWEDDSNASILGSIELFATCGENASFSRVEMEGYPNQRWVQ